MINLVVANLQDKGKRKNDRRKFQDQQQLETLLKAQIDNSLELDWNPEKIWIVTNFGFEYNGVKALINDLNKECLTGSKTYAISNILNGCFMSGEVIWAHDLDAWQNAVFQEPEMKQVGICYYSRPKINGGSIFYRMEEQTKIIVKDLVEELDKDKEGREEPVLDRILNPKRTKYLENITVMNTTYNIGCSGFVPRYNGAEKPVKVLHFHPTNRVAWDTFCRDRNRIGNFAISDRLKNIMLCYFGDRIREFTYHKERGYDGNWDVPCIP